MEPIAMVGVGCPGSLPPTETFWSEGRLETSYFLGTSPYAGAAFYWTGPAEDDWVATADWYGGFLPTTPLTHMGTWSEATYYVNGWGAFGCVLEVRLRVFWTAMCTEQVVRNYMDERDTPGGDGWAWAWPSGTIRGSKSKTARAVGNIWNRDHVRGLCFKAGSQVMSRFPNQRIEWTM